MKLRILLAGLCAMAVFAVGAGSASAAYPGEWHMTAVSQPDHRTVTFEVGPAPSAVVICQGSEVAGTGIRVTSMKFNGCKYGGGTGISTVVTVPTLPNLSVTTPVLGQTRVTFNNLRIRLAIGTYCPTEFIGSAYGEGPERPTTSESFTAATSKLPYYVTTYGSCNGTLFLPNESMSFIANYASDPI